jgi:uncharacterized hydrophobic protein (TIGR00271 family)
MANDTQIDEQIRAGIELKGVNAITLILAIFIASVGLNVNSTAVIIGAMLISPLMGPIMGAGYGVAIYDFPLIRKSVLNLAIAAGISLISSTVYFLITPLGEAQSELLARTSPSFWDVAIAVLGGLAGAIGMTRKEKSNVIPGVAIATALMPPLCTAGYGIAHLNSSYFVGALYLFSINCVFIAVATVVVMGYLNLPHKNFVDQKTEKKMKLVLYGVVAVTALPSFFLAYKLVQQEIFKSTALQFIDREIQSETVQVAKTNIDPSNRKIDVTLVGDLLPKQRIEELNSKLPKSGLSSTKLSIYQGADNRIDVTAIREGILDNLYRNSVQAVQDRDKTIAELEAKIRAISTEEQLAESFILQLKAQHPVIQSAIVGRGDFFSESETSNEESHSKKKVALLVATLKSPMPRDERQRLERWFQIVSQDESARVVLEVKKR